jgi:hypothetical protein
MLVSSRPHGSLLLVGVGALQSHLGSPFTFRSNLPGQGQIGHDSRSVPRTGLDMLPQNAEFLDWKADGTVVTAP